MSTDDARTRILNAAGPIFAEKGYEAATVREICQEAGVNLASVNYYFGGKERLYVETVRLAHPARFRPRASPEWPEGTPPGAKLRDFIRWMMTHLLDRKTGGWHEQLIVREIMNPTPACGELLREHFRAGFGPLEQILDEILPPETPAYKRHQIGFSIVGQCVYYRSSGKILPLIVGEEELEAYYGIEHLTEHVLQVSLAALGLGPPVAGPSKPGANSGESACGAGEVSVFPGPEPAEA
jgi:AcrR family transcriptional regulator